MTPERLWTSAEWRRLASGWMDDRLANARIKRTGDVTQPRVRPWGTVLTASTSAGLVWMKAPGPETVFEVPLYDLLRKVVPQWIVPPIAVDVERGWLLLPDGGVRFYDWGDSVVAHPFASMIVSLKDMTVLHGFAPGDPVMLRLRDAYLEVFTDLAPRRELVVQLDLACRIGMIARALVWVRALLPAGGQSDFETAPLDTLQSVLTGKWQ